MTLMAIDPGRSLKGDKSIGYALFTVGGTEISRGSLTYSEMTDVMSPQLSYEGEMTLWIGDYAIDEVVIEDFVNNDRSRGGQTNGTSECIGMVEFACHITETPFTRQAPAALGPAKLHAPEGSYKPLKHLRHEDSAFLHGYEYLVKAGTLSVDLSATLTV